MYLHNEFAVNSVNKTNVIVNGVTEHSKQQMTPFNCKYYSFSKQPVCQSTTKGVHALQMVVMFVCFIVFNESTDVTEVCGGLQNSMDLEETAPSVCSETGLTVCVDGSEVSDMRAEVVLYTQKEEDFELSLWQSVEQFVFYVTLLVKYRCHFVVSLV